MDRREWEEKKSLADEILRVDRYLHRALVFDEWCEELLIEYKFNRDNLMGPQERFVFDRRIQLWEDDGVNGRAANSVIKKETKWTDSNLYVNNFKMKMCLVHGLRIDVQSNLNRWIQVLEWKEKKYGKRFKGKKQ